MVLDKMTTHYLVTALWSTVNYGDEGRALDADFSISDISEEFQQKAFNECAQVYSLIEHLITEDEMDLETIGHDFWLTRNRHGAGFWDGDYENGDEITEITKKHFGQNDDDLNNSMNDKQRIA